MADEFAGGMVDGFRGQLETTDAAGIKDAVTDWITDQTNIDKIRDELVKEMGDSSAAQIDLALTDIFGSRATPITELSNAMRQDAERNATQLQETGAVMLNSVIEGGLTQTNEGASRWVDALLEAATRRTLVALGEAN
jgi:hypothetical protein